MASPGAAPAAPGSPPEGEDGAAGFDGGYTSSSDGEVVQRATAKAHSAPACAWWVFKRQKKAEEHIRLVQVSACAHAPTHT